MKRNADAGRLFPAMLLIGLGVLFLLLQLDIIGDFNWWAIFIIFPGAMMLWSAYQEYGKTHAMGSGVLAPAAIGGFLVLLGLSFIFDIGAGWISNFWPIILIVIGVAMLFGRGPTGGKAKR